MYFCVCKRQTEKDREREWGKGEDMECYEEGEKEGRIPEAML